MAFCFSKINGKLIFNDLGGYQTRNSSTFWCIQKADEKYNWNDFNEITIHTGDYENDNNDLITCIICFHDLTYRSQFINFLKENQINEYDIIENEEEIKNTFYDILDMKSIRK